MKMALVCAAKSCKSHEFENDNSNLVFFPFPDDEETCRTWVLRTGRHDLLYRRVEEIHLTEFLCERHFEDTCLDRSGPVALKPKAIPTLFDADQSSLPKEIMEDNEEPSSVDPDIVVIPCVIMNDVNTEVIKFDGEHIKEENMNRDEIERELRLIHEGCLVEENVLTGDTHRIDVSGELRTAADVQTILEPDSMVVDSIHAVETSAWSEENTSHNLTDQLCRVCGTDNNELMPVFGEQSVQLQVIDKIQWHLPIVIKEDDKLPLKICTSCVSLLNSWHDLVTTCMETDARLRKLFNDEEFDPSTSVYCDLSPSTPDRAVMDPSVRRLHDVLSSDTLESEPDTRNAVLPLDELTLQTAEESIGLEMAKDVPGAGTIQFFSRAKQMKEKSISGSRNLRVNGICASEQYSEDSVTSSAKDGIHEIIDCIKEENYEETNDSVSKEGGEGEDEKSSFGVRGSSVLFQVSSEKSEDIKVEISEDSSEFQIDEGNGVEEEVEEKMEEEEQEGDEGEGDDDEVDVGEEENIYDDVNENNNNNNGRVVKGKMNRNVLGRRKIMRAVFCDLCGFSTDRKTKLLQHIIDKHSSSAAMFMCEYCDKMFPSEAFKKAHERAHMKFQPKPSSACFMCEYCGRSFRTKKTLKEHHIAMHSDDKPYKCDKCEKNYGSLSSLDIHKATHSSETPYLCDLCGKTFKHVSNLRSHKRSHLDDSDKNRQICAKCGKGFRSRFHLSEHMNVHDGNRPYTCEVCGKCFHKKIQLRQHGSAHSGTQPYNCPVCGVKFNRRGNMTQHMKRHTQERKYTCRVCGVSFPTLGAVLNHRKKHSEVEVQKSTQLPSPAEDPDQVAFKCSICGKLLAKKESLAIHMRSHTGEKLFSCPECGKRLSNKGSLTYHMRSFHTGERPHACQFCGDGFLSKEARLVHERIHTGEKPFECAVCGMAFRCSSNLAQHARVHSDARPHACLACGKRFQRKGALDVHMRTHTGERPFPCDLCGRAFTQKNDMLKHRRTHTHEKPYACAHCPCVFAQKRELSRHRLAKHLEEQDQQQQQEEEEEEAAAAAPGQQQHQLLDPTQLLLRDPGAAVAAAVAEAVAAEGCNVHHGQDDDGGDHDPTALTVTVPVHHQEDSCSSSQDMQTVVITTTADGLLSAFPDITVPGIEHAQTVTILQRF